MSLSKSWHAEKIYINEIIRITYKCNWSCKFCNVLKTNNFGEHDVSEKEVIYKILQLTRKYTLRQREKLILSFSWWEPTLSKYILSYIKLAKSIWVGVVEIQTNGTKLFKEKEYILKLIEAWLDEIFLAQHSHLSEINKELWSFYKISDFQEWVKYILSNNLHKKVGIYLNIVVTKINIFYLYEYLKFLVEIGFIDIIPVRHHMDIDLAHILDDGTLTHKISFWFCQPNWYANLNKEKVLLKYTDEEISEIKKVVEFCKINDILPDFHFVWPPLCILEYPEYNLEYDRLFKLERDTANQDVNISNLESYKFLWKEKMKFEKCKKCKYNNYCLGFYKNWVTFAGEEYVEEKINQFLLKQSVKENSYE